MIDIQGIKIERLPFDNLILQNELLEFDGSPMLLHYQYTRITKRGEEKHDALSLIVEFDENVRRYILWKVEKKELYLFLNKDISLRDILSDTQSEYIYIIEEDANGDFTSIICINSYSLPEQYIPTDKSYYLYGLSDFYQQYLDSFDFDDRLLKKSYTITLDANNNDQKHQHTIAAKDAGAAITNYNQSIYGYAYVKAYKELSHLQSNDKINKQRASKFAETISPRLMGATLCCFEFTIAMDTIIFHDPDSVETKLSKVLIESYKKDVLDVDYGSEEDAKIIADNFTAAERKRIFEPIFKVLENENIEVTVTDFKKSFNRSSKKYPLKQNVKEIVIPPKTLDELEEEVNKRQKIYTIVFTLKEGTDLGKIRLKQVMDNLLFTEEGAETNYPIVSPIIVDNLTPVELNYPIRCRLYINPDGNIINVSNDTLMLNADGTVITEVIDTIKRQFIVLIQMYMRNRDNKDPKFEELKTLLKYPEDPFRVV